MIATLSLSGSVQLSLVFVCLSLPVLVLCACEFQYAQDPTAPVDRPCDGLFPADSKSEGDFCIWSSSQIALPPSMLSRVTLISRRQSTATLRYRHHSSARRAISPRLQRSVASAWWALIRSSFRAGQWAETLNVYLRLVCSIKMHG